MQISDRRTVPKDADAVRDAEHLIELVRHQHDGDALRS
jgi:hypothetical protein